ncbi:hypothetical protein EJ08DRAFT_655982 [Tothia fuscella]|uniref:Uncharacterized protein n=1 Tax=Tothia fuscella TaxID=1048955 RepID=A0A9P4P168_9PEZI|nr:hypothetical protein EJ08DRAFT_655982 [Tothia fuscella]
MGTCYTTHRTNNNGNGGGWASTWGAQPKPSTVYQTLPVTYTITTTLPGFYSPKPVTSYSTIVSMVTVTLNQPPPGQNPNSPQTIWQTTTLNGPIPWLTSTRTNRPPPSLPSTTTIKGTNSPYTPPWSVPPSPPTSIVPPVQTQSPSRPPVWTPPVNTGPSWTPVPNASIPAQPPSSPAAPTPQPAPPKTTAAPLPPVSPPPVAPPAVPTPVASSPAGPPAVPPPPKPAAPGSPQVCGPGAPKCPEGLYCDPQPLCSIGNDDCAGICLSVFSTRRNVKITQIQQPWEVRRRIWQGLLDQGTFIMYGYNGTAEEI